MPSAKRLPSSLPLRMVRLHAKLVLAILVGIAVTVAIKPLTLGWGTRALAGWDAGVVVYLSLTLSLMWRANITHIRRRASEQDGALARSDPVNHRHVCQSCRGVCARRRRQLPKAAR
jgi:uncharacterized membrane protein